MVGEHCVVYYKNITIQCIDSYTHDDDDDADDNDDSWKK